jgi:hypothetical protein
MTRLVRERENCAQMTADDIIALLDVTKDRAELLALLAPLRLPEGVSDFDRGRITAALTRAAARCWQRRVSAA